MKDYYSAFVAKNATTLEIKRPILLSLEISIDRHPDEFRGPGGCEVLVDDTPAV